MDRSRHCIQTAEPSSCPQTWGWGRGNKGPGQLWPSTHSSSGYRAILSSGPPTALQAIPPAALLQAGAAQVCSAAPGSPSLWFQPSTPSMGPAHLAVLDEANKVFKAVVAEEGGLEHWPVLTRQHQGDGVCGGSRISPASSPPSSTYTSLQPSSLYCPVQPSHSQGPSPPRATSPRAWESIPTKHADS